MNLLKFLLVIGVLTNLGFSHDEGHGPKLKAHSRNGGKVSAVIDAANENSGKGAELLYKGELVHKSRDLNVKFFLYDKEMKPVKLSEFSEKVTGVQIERKGSSNFELTLDPSGKFYTGKRPKNKRVPFDIELQFSKGKKKFLSAFEKLD